MLIKEVMTPTPATCKPTDTLDKVAKLMLDHDCGEIPVVEGTKLAGVVTDRDIVIRAVAEGKVPKEVPVSDVMTKNVYTITDDTTVDAAIDLMEQKLVRRLPVLDKTNKVVGIVSEADLIAKVPTEKVATMVKNVAAKTRKAAVTV